MNSKRLFDNSSAGVRVGASSIQPAGNLANGTKKCDLSVASSLDNSLLLACTNGPTSGSVLYTFVLDDGSSLREGAKKTIALNGEKHHDTNKMVCTRPDDQRGTSPSIGVLKPASPTHCLILNGQIPDGLVHSEIRLPGKRLEALHNGYQPTAQAVTNGYQSTTQAVTNGYEPTAQAVTNGYQPTTQAVTSGYQAMAQAVTSGYQPTTQAIPNGYQPTTQAVNSDYQPMTQAQQDRYPIHPSSHIPVPRHRKPSGHADKEVMAATVLTTLSTSPLVLNPTPTAAVPEVATRWRKEALSASYSSSTSGNWSWDNSDQSVPSTPSPPLSNDTSKSFLLSVQGDDVTEDVSETTHFLFEDPIPRKRKNSMKVMFKCSWKNCEKVLSTSSGIQRHIRTAHLGRNVDSDYSDGEEDFYYSEIEVNMDSLTEGLSSLTPTSPTTSGPPPVFPLLAVDVPRSEPSHIAFRGPPSHAPSLLSQSAPSTLCHIRTDHAYQGPVSQVRTVNIGEKRMTLPTTTTTVNKSPIVATLTPKPVGVQKKPRGEAKKCRKVYGMEKKEMWCTACRWKKACQRFTD